VAKKILIVEDDKDLQNILSELLKDEGYLIETASNGSTALKKIENTKPHLVLLDLGLPDIQGETILTIIRNDYPEIRVIILTAKSKPEEIAQGLNLGADDYLSKPFASEELFARIHARVKPESNNNGQLKLGDLILDLNKMIAIRNESKINLTKTEFNLLKFLMENVGHVVSRDLILNHVWGYTTDVESRVVDVYIGYLRDKIDTGFKKKLIKNKRGFGYMIDN
jgi:DNA-binding response OmpR family regulator